MSPLRCAWWLCRVVVHMGWKGVDVWHVTVKQESLDVVQGHVGVERRGQKDVQVEWEGKVPKWKGGDQVVVAAARCSTLSVEEPHVRSLCQLVEGRHPQSQALPFEVWYRGTWSLGGEYSVQEKEPWPLRSSP